MQCILLALCQILFMIVFCRCARTLRAVHALLFSEWLIVDRVDLLSLIYVRFKLYERQRGIFSSAPPSAYISQSTCTRVCLAIFTAHRVTCT